MMRSHSQFLPLLLLATLIFGTSSACSGQQGKFLQRLRELRKERSQPTEQDEFQPLPELSWANFEKYQQQILPVEEELAWREIVWQPNLTTGVQVAQQQGKPMLIWLMNGNPGGCTCMNGKLDKHVIWGDPKIQSLASEFVAVAESMDGLNRSAKNPQDIAQPVAKAIKAERLYGLVPTQQGNYIISPAGIVLAATKSGDTESTAEMMRAALTKWQQLPQEQRVVLDSDGSKAKLVADTQYPDDGLVLKLYSRVLDPDAGKKAKRGTDFSAERQGPFAARLMQQFSVAEANQDFVWFKREELSGFLPEKLEVGAEREVADQLIERLARFHFTGTLRTFAAPYPEEAVKQAALSAKVTAVEGPIVTLQFSGETKTSQTGMSKIASFGPAAERRAPVPRKPNRGYEPKLLGTAKWDQQQQKFVEFKLLGLGKHWGGALMESDDTHNVGVFLTLAGHDPIDRVRPDLFHCYEW